MKIETHVIKVLVFRVIASLVLLAVPSRALTGVIEDLPPGEWLELPNTKIQSVLPNPLPPGSPAAIINAWGG